MSHHPAPAGYEEAISSNSAKRPIFQRRTKIMLPSNRLIYWNFVIPTFFVNTAVVVLFSEFVKSELPSSPRMAHRVRDMPGDR